MTTEQRRALANATPTTDVIRDAVTFPRDRLGEPLDISPERFEAWLARVRRDAAREALDGLAKAELDRVANLGKHSCPAQIAQGIAQAAWNHKWKNYGGAHPEETP